MPSTTSIMRRTRPAAIATLLAAAVAVNAYAEDYELRPRSIATSPTHSTADGQLVDVQIRVQGQTTPMYFKPGRYDRHYFQAFKGRNYSLVVRNNTGRRVGVLIAVDGLNVVNGEMSRLAHNEPMYVLDPYEDAVIAGWRTSLDDVRKFVFVDEQRSYAERTGQANGDMGWIRVMAFREVTPIGWWDRLKYKDQNNDGWLDDEASGRDRGDYDQRAAKPAPSAPEAAREMTGKKQEMEGGARSSQLGDSRSNEEGNPGTGWGERRHDPVRRTEFRGQHRATDQIVMRYEYQAGLRALGIFPRTMRTWEREDGRLGFAQPPGR